MSEIMEWGGAGGDGISHRCESRYPTLAIEKIARMGHPASWFRLAKPAGRDPFEALTGLKPKEQHANCEKHVRIVTNTGSGKAQSTL